MNEIFVSLQRKKITDSYSNNWLRVSQSADITLVLFLCFNPRYKWKISISLTSSSSHAITNSLT